jgi:preprotein translocase SecE subunit
MFKTIVKFIQEAKTELMKVSWPSRSTVIGLTAAVLGVSLLFALYTSAVDFGLTKGVQWLVTYSANHKTKAGTPIQNINVGGNSSDGTPIRLGQ